MKQTQVVNVKVNIGKTKKRKRSSRVRKPSVASGQPSTSAPMVAIPQFRQPEHTPVAPPNTFYLTGQPWMAPTPWSQTTKADISETPLFKRDLGDEFKHMTRAEALTTIAEEPRNVGIFSPLDPGHDLKPRPRPTYPHYPPGKYTPR